MRGSMIAGIIGSALLAKGGASLGGSLLGSLLNGVSALSGGSGRGGGCGGGGGSAIVGSLINGIAGQVGSKGKGGGRGKGGKLADNSDGSNPLFDLVTLAVQKLQSNQSKAPAVAAKSSEIIDVTATESATKPSIPQQSSTPIDTETALTYKAAALHILTDSMTSYMPGRMRIRHPALKNSKAFPKLKDALLQAGFHEVEFKAVTGSVLLTWAI